LSAFYVVKIHSQVAEPCSLMDSDIG
jgi:hypothetical protein